MDADGWYEREDAVGWSVAMMGYGWGTGPTGWVFMVLFWVVVIGLLVWAAVSPLPGDRAERQSGPESPPETLDRRFALGELDLGELDLGELDAEQHRRAREELIGTRAVVSTVKR